MCFTPYSFIRNYPLQKARHDQPSNNCEILFEFTKNQSNSNHNGGKIAFGTDGYLYISVGDGGGANDPQNNSQNINNAFGSILRIDVDVDGSNPISSNGNYEIPSDNPFASTAGLDEIYAYGIRNTWKFSVDDVTGNIWGAEVDWIPEADYRGTMKLGHDSRYNILNEIVAY